MTTCDSEIQLFTYCASYMYLWNFVGIQVLTTELSQEWWVIGYDMHSDMFWYVLCM